MILEAHGVRLQLPSGWSGRVFRHNGSAATLHAGDFQLAIDSGQFGDRSTAKMPALASFIALTEYLPGKGLQPGVGLYASRRIPRQLDPASFHAAGLAHPRPGQVGVQHFFTASGRPMCLYVVIKGPRTKRRHQLAVLDHVLASLRVGPRR